MNRKMVMRNFFFFLAVVIILIGSVPQISADNDADFFPVYESIKPNIAFWTDIYSRYSTRQGVLHDNQKLDLIYGIIELTDPDLPGGRKINRKRTKAAKKHYRSILARLAEGNSPDGSEEQRIAALFGPDATAGEYWRARKNIRCQVGQSDRFRAGLIRSGAYLDEIKQIFRKHDLPEDLALLPHVESSFNYKAYSKFGAAGMWQFTRSTGKRYMSIGYAIDERRDPILSTRAAARLLKRNYARLHNWPMAITAYNHGANGMLRAKRAKGTYEAIFNSHSTRLFQFASRNFYSEFLAARHVASNYRQYFGELELDRPQPRRHVRLEGYVSLPELAQHLELDVETLQRLNPALRKPVLEGKKYIPRGYQLKLPPDEAHELEKRIVQLAPRVYKSAQTRSRFYRVRYGDTAGKIAKKHGIRLKDLMAANNLNARAIIYVNQNLSIPWSGEPLPSLPVTTVAQADSKMKNPSIKPDNPQINPVLIAQSAPAPRLEDQPSITSPDPLARQASAGKPPVVVAGIYNIDTVLTPNTAVPDGQRTVKQPRASDRIDPPSNRPAKIPSAAAAAQSPEVLSTNLNERGMKQDRPVSITDPNPDIITGNLTVERVFIQAGRPTGIIYVAVEETLGHYAEWLGIRTQDLRRLNNFPYGKIIRLGQELKIPLQQTGKDDFEEKRYEFHKELAEDFFAAYRIESLQPYFIKSGDNIWTLARQSFELPLWLIQRYNANVDLDALMPSQKLMIPVIEKNV